MGVIPPGGFKFAQRLPNGGFHWFFASTRDDLVRQLIQFRSQAGIEAGDPLTETKHLVSGASHTLNTYRDGRSLRERVTAWKANRQFGKLELVDQETANERASLAAQCSHNVLNYADSCLECYSSTLRDLFAMRQGKSTPYDSQLGADSICGHDNQTAVWLDAKHLKHIVNYLDELKEKCPNCWLLKLDQNTNKEVA